MCQFKRLAVAVIGLEDVKIMLLVPQFIVIACIDCPVISFWRQCQLYR